MLLTNKTTNKQTNKQTNAAKNIASLDGGNKMNSASNLIYFYRPGHFVLMITAHNTKSTLIKRLDVFVQGKKV